MFSLVMGNCSLGREPQLGFNIALYFANYETGRGGREKEKGVGVRV